MDAIPERISDTSFSFGMGPDVERCEGDFEIFEILLQDLEIS